jgi:hypothetical protein
MMILVSSLVHTCLATILISAYWAKIKFGPNRRTRLGSPKVDPRPTLVRTSLLERQQLSLFIVSK